MMKSFTIILACQVCGTTRETGVFPGKRPEGLAATTAGICPNDWCDGIMLPQAVDWKEDDHEAG